MADPGEGRGPPKEAEAHFEPAVPNLFFGTKTDARSLLAHRRSFCYFPE